MARRQPTPPDKPIPPPPDQAAMLVQAWMDTRMEIDRTLVSLSAGGVALLVGLLAAADLPADLRWYGAAIGAFLLAVTAGVTVLHLNARLLRISIKDLGAANKSRTEAMLSLCSWALMLLFAAGVLLSVLAGHDTALARRAANLPTTAEAQYGRQDDPSLGHPDQAGSVRRD